MNVLLTGGAGFLGSRLATDLQSQSGVILTLAVRSHTKISAANTIKVQGLSADTDWSSALADQNVVIHSAARTHIMKDEVLDPFQNIERLMLTER